ncbi:ATP-binding cassette domain-containing protein [Maribacter halichondriae]|uniref:ATP-binding cassette domain-containing protein n=1 Tax=Maribacter halichondriae TaxID=2980554 RepID=UPI0023595776|nr:ATP-binding cassette domain-containing protein [Maribacter sp. Hal144]
MKKKHWAIFIDNSSDKSHLIDELLNHPANIGFKELNGQRGILFSKLALEQFMDEEERHGIKTITSDTLQSLTTRSSGEQKKALLKHVLKSNPQFIILDNPFDNLDTVSQEDFKHQLQKITRHTSIVQLISRASDLLPFVNTFARLKNTDLTFYPNVKQARISNSSENFDGTIPSPIEKMDFEGDILIELNHVNVSYSGKPILNNISWKIQKGSFWELRGKNGSGKTTILSMITGENPKGYGENLFIFGQKKGSGESVWDIKKRIGYFTPAMTDKFMGYHTVQNMLISGLTDSIGLYVRPTEAQTRLAKEWLALIGMWNKKDSLFHDLTMGQKRLVMCARAMVKHPLLLILDEPTAGLDDASALLFVALVNKFAKESDTTIVFVSHRREPSLNPDYIYELTMEENGSTGRLK